MKIQYFKTQVIKIIDGKEETRVWDPTCLDCFYKILDKHVDAKSVSREGPFVVERKHPLECVVCEKEL